MRATQKKLLTAARRGAASAKNKLARSLENAYHTTMEMEYRLSRGDVMPSDSLMDVVGYLSVAGQILVHLPSNAHNRGDARRCFESLSILARAGFSDLSQSAMQKAILKVHDNVSDMKFDWDRRY